MYDKCDNAVPRRSTLALDAESEPVASLRFTVVWQILAAAVGGVVLGVIVGLLVFLALASTFGRFGGYAGVAIAATAALLVFLIVTFTFALNLWRGFRLNPARNVQ